MSTTENRTAQDVNVGDQRLVPLVVVEKRIRADQIGLVWSTGETTWHQPDDAVEIAEPDPTPTPNVPTSSDGA